MKRLRFEENPELAISQACEQLAAGEPVALPTETVYGLAADATNALAAAKIFAAKERPFFDPLIVHLPSLEFLPEVAEIPEETASLVSQLIERFWPGPLTIVLPKRPNVPDLVTSGLPTVAVRMSAHPVFQRICSRFGSPLAAPSANRFGRISPTCADHVVEELTGKIGLVIDGGPTTHGVESTIILPSAHGIQILRHGPISPDQFSFTSILETPVSETEQHPIAPGRIDSHYAPRTPLTLVTTARAEKGKRCGLLAWAGAFAHEFDAVEWLSPTGDLTEAASKLFSAMRRLDASGVELIVAERVPATGIGLAILDRLSRAAW